MIMQIILINENHPEGLHLNPQQIFPQQIIISACLYGTGKF